MDADLQSFEEICQAAMSPDNQVRKEAEQVFQDGRENPESFYSYLARLLVFSKDPMARTFCAVMLRQNLSLSNQNYTQVPDEVKGQIENNMLDLLKSEENRSLRLKIADVISALSVKAVKEERKWPELIPCLQELSASNSDEYQHSAVSIYSKLAEYCLPVLEPIFDDVINTMSNALTSDNDDLRLAALTGMVALLISVDDETRMNMIDALPLMFQNLEHSVEQKEDAAVVKIVEQMVNLAISHPTFFRPHLEAAISGFVHVAQVDDLEPETRTIAHEFLVTMAEKGGGMVRRMPDFAPQCFELCIQFMSTLDHDNEAWSERKEDEEDNTLYTTGVDGMLRLSEHLGGKLTMEHAFPLIQDLMNGSSWEEHHCALMALSKIAGGCITQLKPMLDTIVPVIGDVVTTADHPRVQWAAVNTLAQLAVDFEAYFQETFHEVTFPAIFHLMMKADNPRVINHCALAIVDVMAHCPEQILEQYIEDIMSNLSNLMNPDAHPKVLEAAFAATAAVSAAGKGIFDNYYDYFMPIAKEVIATATSPDMLELRGKAMECVGHMGIAVGKERFAEDAKIILNSLLESAQEGRLSADDPQYAYLVQTLCRICQCVGDDFVEYLPIVIPPLLASADNKDAAHFFMDEAEAAAAEQREGYSSLELNFRGFGKTKLSFNVTAMQDMTLACNVLYQYIVELKDGFLDWVQPTAQVLIPLVAYPFNEDVRLNAITAMPALLECYWAHDQKLEEDTGRCNELFDNMFDYIIQALSQERSYEAVNHILDELNKCLSYKTTPLSDEQMEIIAQALVELVESEEEQRAELVKTRDSDDFDEEAEAVLESEVESFNELLGHCHAVIESTAKASGEAWIPFFHQYLYQSILRMLLPEKEHEQNCCALCIFGDVIANCGEAAHQYLNYFYPLALQNCSSSNEDVRQSAAWGVGAVATIMGEEFLPETSQALDVLFEIINRADSKSEDNEPSTCVAVTAVAKICKHQLLLPNQEQVAEEVFPMWLNQLPQGGDLLEAQVCHQMLLDFIGDNVPYLIGQNSENLPLIVKIFAAIYNDEDICTQATQAAIRDIWHKLNHSLNAGEVDEVMQLCDNEQKQVLASILQ